MLAADEEMEEFEYQQQQAAAQAAAQVAVDDYASPAVMGAGGALSGWLGV